MGPWQWLKAHHFTWLGVKSGGGLQGGEKGRGDIRGAWCREEVPLRQACPQGCTSKEGKQRKKGSKSTPKPVTCWKKHWGKGLGDISLKSGHLSRGEPPQPLCTGEPQKSRAMLVDGGGLSRTWRMALSWGEEAAAGGNRVQLGTV